MIWFDINKLEQKISNNELTDNNGFNYFLAYSILTLFALCFATNKTNGWMMFSEFAISVLITIWGLKTVYEVNNEIDGKDFLKRFFAISWVIGMRMSVVLIPLSFILVAIAVASNMNIRPKHLSSIQQREIISLTFKVVFTLICYLLIINSFKRLRIKNSKSIFSQRWETVPGITFRLSPLKETFPRSQFWFSQ